MHQSVSYENRIRFLLILATTPVSGYFGETRCFEEGELWSLHTMVSEHREVDGDGFDIISQALGPKVAEELRRFQFDIRCIKEVNPAQFSREYAAVCRIVADKQVVALENPWVTQMITAQELQGMLATQV